MKLEQCVKEKHEKISDEVDQIHVMLDELEGQIQHLKDEKSSAGESDEFRSLPDKKEKATPGEEVKECCVIQ